MLVLLAAAALAAHPPSTERMPNLYQAPAHCRGMQHQVVDRYGRPLAIRLGDLPKAGAQLLVDRKVDGCRVITLMGRGPVPAPDQPNPPASQYRMVPLEPRPPGR